MALIDPRVTFRKVEERLETETDPVLRRNLDTLLTHMKAEMAGDVDGLLATLSENPALSRVRQRRPELEPGRPRRGARVLRPVHRVRRGAAAARHRPTRGRQGLHPHRGRDAHRVPGRTLRAMGIEVDDDDAYYLYETRMATLWPFDQDGRATGEDTYTGDDGFAGIADRKLAPDDIVQYAPAG